MPTLVMPKIVLVEWEDASMLDTDVWVDKESAPEPEATVFHQVGFLLANTRKHVVLTCTDGKRLMGARTRIPKGMVRKITELGPLT